jgi:hypothetical protein
MLTRLTQEIRDDEHLRGFFNIPEHPEEERRGPTLPETVREGLVAFLTDRLARLGPLAGLLAEGVIDGLPALAEAAVDQFTRFEEGMLRNALSRVAERVMQRILGTRLRHEEAEEEESQLPPSRTVEGVGQPFGMRGITIPVRIGRRAYERQRRRQQLMREEERERLREEE